MKKVQLILLFISLIVFFSFTSYSQDENFNFKNFDPDAVMNTNNPDINSAFNSVGKTKYKPYQKKLMEQIDGFKAHVKKVESSDLKDNKEIYSKGSFNSFFLSAKQVEMFINVLNQDDPLGLLKGGMMEQLFSAYSKTLDSYVEIVRQEKIGQCYGQLINPYKAKMRALRDKYTLPAQKIRDDFDKWNSTAKPFDDVPESICKSSHALHDAAGKEHVKINQAYMKEYEEFAKECLREEERIRDMACSTVNELVKQGYSGLKIKNGEISLLDVADLEIVRSLPGYYDENPQINIITAVSCKGGVPVIIPEWNVRLKPTDFRCRIGEGKDDDCFPGFSKEMGKMNISDEGLDILMTNEGFVNHAYDDTKEKGLKSIGYGHQLNIEERDIYDVSGKKISKEEGYEFLKGDIKRFENAINKLVTVPLKQNQFDALVDLVYNIGIGAFKDSTILKELKNSDCLKVGEAYLMWNKVDGKINEGLNKRRFKGKDLFFQ
ncbi:MAG: lysozyme [bacterium]|nr:lysozyme [bacterium]